MHLKTRLLLLFCCFQFAFGMAQEKFTLSGTISDLNSNETLIGVNIYVPALKLGTTTNAYGFYSMTLPEGTYDFEFSYVGYQTIVESIAMTENVKKNLSLSNSGEQLEEVVITEKPRANIRKAEMSVNKLSIATIKKCRLCLAK